MAAKQRVQTDYGSGEDHQPEAIRETPEVKNVAYPHSVKPRNEYLRGRLLRGLEQARRGEFAEGSGEEVIRRAFAKVFG